MVCPGFVIYPNDTKHYYYRFGHEEGVEPFIARDFHGLKPSYLDISQKRSG
jgi:hypothetical protein